MATIGQIWMVADRISSRGRSLHRDPGHSVRCSIGRSSHHGCLGTRATIGVKIGIRARVRISARAGFCETRASPGGTPEPEDGGDLVATLVREAFEENQVRVGATAYLGYQEVDRPGRARYAQVRMAGVIEEFAPRAPDPDGGRVYRRLMTSLEAAPGVLGWGEPAVAQARAASRVARREWGLPVDAPAPSGYAD